MSNKLLPLMIKYTNTMGNIVNNVLKPCSNVPMKRGQPSNVCTSPLMHTHIGTRHAEGAHSIYKSNLYVESKSFTHKENKMIIKVKFRDNVPSCQKSIYQTTSNY